MESQFSQGSPVWKTSGISHFEAWSMKVGMIFGSSSLWSFWMSWIYRCTGWKFVILHRCDRPSLIFSTHHARRNMQRFLDCKQVLPELRFLECSGNLMDEDMLEELLITHSHLHQLAIVGELHRQSCSGRSWVMGCLKLQPGVAADFEEWLSRHWSRHAPQKSMGGTCRDHRA